METMTIRPKLGKLPAQVDPKGRTLKFARLLQRGNLPVIPSVYDLDGVLGITDTHMYLNDTFGDCVEAGSAHAINRFEMFECKALPNIPDADVKAQYFKETGGADDGLVLLTHLKMWRKTGLLFGGKTYQIYAFASVDWKKHTEVMECIYLLDGVYLGMQVPKYFIDGFMAGARAFDVQKKNKAIEGGHCIYSPAFLIVAGFNAVGPVIVTWGARVQLTWAFWDKYVDEAYGIIDAIDKWVNPATDPLNIPLLTKYLAAINAG